MTRRARFWLAGMVGWSAVSCVPPTVPPAPAPPAPTPVTTPKPRVQPGTVSGIGITEFFTLHQAGKPLVFDVRPAIFHGFGHIPGSVSWPKGKFDAGLATHEPSLRAAIQAGRPVVLYCTDRKCPDSGTVARTLAALGYSVAILEGGYEEWQAAGLPTE